MLESFFDQDLNNLLNNFIVDPEDSNNNFNLAFYYESIGQSASAISYYLRSAERTEDPLCQYESLIRASICFDNQGTRNFTVKGLLQRAISICPKRPEGYYLLSRFYENENSDVWKDGKWNYSYLMASMGENVADFNSPPLKTKIDYPGKYAILYQKALAAWWCGLCDESRDIFNDLIKNYDLDDNHRNKVLENLKKFGVTAENLHITYEKNNDKTFDNKLDGFPSVHICSVIESQDRRKNLVDQFQKYNIYPNFHIFEKINKDDNDSEDEYLHKKNYEVSLSHIKMLHDWYHKTDEPYAVFCEDDVSLETVQYWNFTWSQFFDKLPEHWDAVQLSLLCEVDSELNEVKFKPRLFQHWGLQSYLIKREYVKKVLNYHKYDPENNTFDFSINGKPFLSPRPEHILFDSGCGGFVFNFPIFVEEVNKFKSMIEGSSRESDYCGTNSFNVITNWWKQNGSSANLDDLMKKPYKVVDFCSFYGPYGSEMLLLRYHILKGYVDEFVISESSYSHTGIPVKFECKDKIKEWGLPEEKFKVIELNTPPDEQLVIEEIDELNCYDSMSGNFQSDIRSKWARVRDRLSKDALLKVLDDYDDNTIFIHGDIDEIINPSYIPNIADIFIKNNPHCFFYIPLVYLEGRADLRVYNREWNCPQAWDWAMFMCNKSLLKKVTPVQIRSNKLIPEGVETFKLNNSWTGEAWTDVGWHFSWMGGKESRLIKKQSWEHRFDSFDWLVTKKYDESDEFLSSDYQEGDTPPCGMVNLVLKNYSKENLPEQIFDIPIVEKFLFPNITSNIPEKEQKMFKISDNVKQTCWVVDNFYEDPDAIRKFALEQEYVEGGFGRGFIGRRTEKQFLFPGLKEKFEEIMGMKITNWEEHGMNGRFQNCHSGEPLVYHCDSQRWGGMLYLTPEAPYQCGTTLYAHKKSRARTYYDQGWDDSWKDIPGDPHLDRTPFEPVDVVGNVYNRLMIFDASCIHSASEYFGTVMENSRLWQMFFFDTEGWESPLVF